MHPITQIQHLRKLIFRWNKKIRRGQEGNWRGREGKQKRKEIQDKKTNCKGWWFNKYRWTKGLYIRMIIYVALISVLNYNICFHGHVWSLSDGIRLLNRVDIQTFQPNHWFNMPFQSIQFSQSARFKIYKRNRESCIRITLHCNKFKYRVLVLFIGLPCNLSSSFCLFSHLVDFCELVVFTEHLCIRCV